MKTKLFILLFIFCSFAFAGEFGFISGVVTDKESGVSLPGVQIIVQNTDCGAVTNLEGYYEIYNIPPGKYELFVEYLGYTSIQIMNVEVFSDSTTALDIQMDQGNS